MIWLIAYIATIFLANWTLQTFGVLQVGPIGVPAGVLWAGLAFTARDLVQDKLGRWPTIVAIGVGAGLSALVSPQFALASGVAFLLSELADMMVYTPIRERHWLRAVFLSNIAGDVIDSILFLWLAFGSLEYLSGQLIGKWAMTLVAVVALYLWRRNRDNLLIGLHNTSDAPESAA